MDVFVLVLISFVFVFKNFNFAKLHLHFSCLEIISSQNYDEKTDVFSFGISFFEILTCTKPYSDIIAQNSNTFVLMNKINSGIRPGPLPIIPLNIVELIQDCWNQIPQVRPTMNEVIERIQLLKQSRGIVY